MGIVVDINKDREGGQKPSIDALQRLVGEDLQKVNQHILTNMQSPVALIPQLASHLIAAATLL